MGGELLLQASCAASISICVPVGEHQQGRTTKPNFQTWFHSAGLLMLPETTASG